MTLLLVVRWIWFGGIALLIACQVARRVKPTLAPAVALAQFWIGSALVAFGLFGPLAYLAYLGLTRS